MQYRYFITLILFMWQIGAWGQSLPDAEPRMKVLLHEEWTDETEYNGDAPLAARFESNVRNLNGYTPLYEWIFSRVGENEPMLKRFDSNTEYTFEESGAYEVALNVYFVKVGSDTLRYEMDIPFRLTIAESKLEIPNAFSPNGDGVNDVLKVKQGYRSIVSFHAMVFNRWGKKLYEWHDIAQGWDGTSHGKKVPDGAYYLFLQAKGADGRQYKIKKTVSLLRTFDETQTTSP